MTMNDLHDRTWATVRGAVATLPTITLEEAAGGLMELAEVEGPEGPTPESEAAKLWHSLALLILMEVRRRRDVAAN